MASLVLLTCIGSANPAWGFTDEWSAIEPRPVSESKLPAAAEREARWLKQLGSPDARLRRKALEEIEEAADVMTPALRQVIRTLSTSDPDPLVQGRAELLLIAQNQIAGSQRSLELPTTRISTAAKPQAAALRVPLRPLATPHSSLDEMPLSPLNSRPTPLSLARSKVEEPSIGDAMQDEAGSEALASVVSVSDASASEDLFMLEQAREEMSVDETDVVEGVVEAEEAGRVRLTSLNQNAESDEFRVPPAPDELSDIEPNQKPGVIYRPLEQPFAEPTETELLPDFQTMLQTPRDAPTGYSGRSSVLPSEGQTSGHFVPIEDRWRIGLPYWDRYDKGHPPVDDYPYKEGHWYDPFNQNVLKGDYPVIGQHTFLNITAATNMLLELRNVPTPTTPFESTVDPYQNEFFGNPQQFFYNQNFKVSLDLFHGNAAFKPVDWRVKITPVGNLNYLDVNELGVVNPNVLAGTTRDKQDFTLEEWFVEKKIADLSPDYDFMSIRAGSQFFNSDFRGFIFTDTNRGVRLFGTRNANRDQFNVAVFDQLEKDTNSQLNSFHDRDQTILIGNYYRQDFIFPGYTAQASFHYNNDGPSFEFDRNNFLVRPDPTGVYREHRVETYYLGFAGDGHIGRINVNHALYWALGHDSFNPLAGRPQDINGKMAALELSYDRDWARFRTSVFYSSGDNNISDNDARGFDSILDNPAFAGGGFSYWQRQNIRLFGVGLTQRESLIPDLRSSKQQGQANFVNPGLMLLNFGVDADITPKVKLINNANFLWFDKTAVLEQFTFQSNVGRDIGVDLSTGTEYRPFLNDNMIIVAGAALFLPGNGFDDLFGLTQPFTTDNAFKFDASAMFQVFMDVALTF